MRHEVHASRPDEQRRLIGYELAAVPCANGIAMEHRLPSQPRVRTFRRVRWIAFSLSLLFLAVGLASWLIAGALVASANQVVGEAPPDFPFVAAKIPSDSGSQIATWYTNSPDSVATVVLVHGIHGNRKKLLKRAKLLINEGYAVVLIDLQAHGESPGRLITLGHLERHDVQAAVEFARQKNPKHRVGVIGISLGGASAVLGSPLKVDAMVLESVFPTIEEAVGDRVQAKLGPLSCLISPLLLCQIQPRLGVSADRLRPIEHIGEVACPLLIASGDRDPHTTIAETRRLFAAASEPKQLVVFQGARHQDLLEQNPPLYENEVLTFLDQYLLAQPDPVSSARSE